MTNQIDIYITFNKLSQTSPYGSYDIDINTQSKMWKCQVKIPMVEYDEYLSEIKKIFCNYKKDIKNDIQPDIYNL